MDKFKNMKFGSKNNFVPKNNQVSSSENDIVEGSGINPIISYNGILKSFKIPNITMNKNLTKFILLPLIVLSTFILVLGLFVYFGVISPLNRFQEEVKAIQPMYENLFSSLINDRDLVTYEKNLLQLENQISGLLAKRDQEIGHLKNFPYIRDFYNDLDIYVSVGLKLVEAGKEVRPIVEPFADAMGIKTTEEALVKKVGFADAVATWISVMPKVAKSLDPVILKLDEAGEELVKINANKYNINILGLYKNDLSPAVRFAQKTLSEASEYGPDAKEALLIIPGVLGVGPAEKRYMIIMQNDAEIRATGGFWTNFATFKVKNALLTSDFTSKDMYSIDIALDAVDKYYTFPTVPAAYQKYLKVERMYARDTNISPDFSTAISNFNTPFYKLAQQVNPSEFKPVDGYFAINTEVVREFIEITGEVNVNGVVFNKDNVVLELEKIASLSLSQQANRKKVLGDLMEAMLKNVFESDSFLWSKLIEKGVDLMNRKQILVYFNDPNAQKLVEKYNYGGRIVEIPDSDYLFFVSTNLGGDKTNMFIDRKYTTQTYSENGKIMRKVKVTYTYPQPGPEYVDFIKRYQDWFRLYVPEGSELVSIDGNEDSSVYTDKERKKVYFGGFISMGPNETKEITFTYSVPNNVISNGQYNLYIQKQSGVNSEIYEIDTFGTKVTESIDKDFKLSVSSN